MRLEPEFNLIQLTSEESKEWNQHKTRSSRYLKKQVQETAENMSKLNNAAIDICADSGATLTTIRCTRSISPLQPTKYTEPINRGSVKQL
jgi:hypothetical protein